MMKRKKTAKTPTVIPHDTRYVPLTQQYACCVPTCIQMVMLRRNIPLQPAELIGHHMGLVVPPEKSDSFWSVTVSKKRPPAGYGTRLNAKRSATQVFRALNIPLSMRFRLINTFKDAYALENYLHTACAEDRDIALCYRSGSLFDTTSKNGHVCILDVCDVKKHTIRLIDPGPDQPKWRIVSVKKLFDAMKIHGTRNMGGCWELKKI